MTRISDINVKFNPRKKLENETEKQTLCRRLEEYMEYVQAVKNYSNLAFYETLLDYIEERD